MSKNLQELQKALIQMQTPKIQYVGLAVADVLAILFIGLKLANIGPYVPSWSWWWVLSPLYFPLIGRTLIEYGVRVLVKLRTKTVTDV